VRLYSEIIRAVPEEARTLGQEPISPAIQLTKDSLLVIRPDLGAGSVRGTKSFQVLMLEWGKKRHQFRDPEAAADMILAMSPIEDTKTEEVHTPPDWWSPAVSSHCVDRVRQLFPHATRSDVYYMLAHSREVSKASVEAVCQRHAAKEVGTDRFLYFSSEGKHGIFIVDINKFFLTGDSEYKYSVRSFLRISEEQAKYLVEV
jgi:hypothetical protein